MAQPQKIGTTGKLKILSIVWYKVLPAKYGGQKAVAHFNEYLTKETSLVCLCSKNNEVENAGYPVYPLLPTSKWQFLNPFVWINIYRFAKRIEASHIILEFPYHGIAGVLCKKLLGVKLIINTHNIEYLRFKEQKKWWWRCLFYYERWTLKKADAVFFKTKEDSENAAEVFQLATGKTLDLPYGVERNSSIDKEQSQSFVRTKHALKKDEQILLFAGTLDYQPNADAAQWIVHELIPLLSKKTFPFKVLICGRNQYKRFQYLNKLHHPQLVMAGEVNDMETYFTAADVFINPVLSGGGVQTKILDALSHQLNVVCFNAKTVGIKGAGSKLLSVPDNDWTAFADAVVQSIHYKEPTPDAFFENHNWRTIAAKAFQKISTL